MDVFKGALGSHRNYLSYIALNNCCDYFFLVEDHKQKGLNKAPDQYKRLRYFLNAMESLNNIPEYFFHEIKSEQGWRDNQLKDILGKIRSSNPIIRDIEQITNAYKHCVRRNDRDLQAEDMQSPLLLVSIDAGGAEVGFEFESIECEKIMSEAFRFWHEYHNDPDKVLFCLE